MTIINTENSFFDFFLPPKMNLAMKIFPFFGVPFNIVSNKDFNKLSSKC